MKEKEDRVVSPAHIGGGVEKARQARLFRTTPR